MIIPDFKSFPKAGKLLGIDWGSKHIGLAVSAPERNFVFIRPQNSNILKIIKAENIKGIVVGLPLRLDGSESDTTKRVRDFAERLSTETDLPIILFDESLTSFEAAERKAPTAHLDSESASIMLENFIAMMNRV